jgi:hypothetical protein
VRADGGRPRTGSAIRNAAGTSNRRLHLTSGSTDIDFSLQTVLRQQPQ